MAMHPGFQRTGHLSIHETGLTDFTVGRPPMNRNRSHPHREIIHRVISQRLLLMLIETGLSREDAYDTVQPLAMQAWRERRDFRSLVEGAPGITAHLSDEQIAGAFDPAYHQTQVDTLFERVGLG